MRFDSEDISLGGYQSWGISVPRNSALQLGDTFHRLDAAVRYHEISVHRRNAFRDCWLFGVIFVVEK